MYKLFAHIKQLYKGLRPSQPEEKQIVTLCMALSGRTWAWPMTARFLEEQIYPHSDIRLCFLDTSQNRAFHRTVRKWLRNCDYGSFELQKMKVGEKGIAEKNRDEVWQTVAAVCSRIYQNLADRCESPFVFVLEDDIQPDTDVFVELMSHLGGNVASVSATYRHRKHDAFVAWNWSPEGTLLDVQEGKGVEAVGGNGFGCVVLDGALMRTGDYNYTAPCLNYDHNFYHHLVLDLKKTALLDWNCRCRHYAGPDSWR